MRLRKHLSIGGEVAPGAIFRLTWSRHSDQAVDILSHGSEERDRTRSVLNVCEHLMYIFTMARMHRSALMRVFCNLLTPSEN